MKIQPNEFYHIYNQGNNRQTIFFSHSNYVHFLRLVREKIKPISEVLSYCLMPNHFHFLIYTTENSASIKKVGSLDISLLMNGFRQLLSSYAQAVNKEQNKTGSLFRQKTKPKLIEDKSESYLLNVFNYIHQNPIRAGLVQKMEDWEYSSFKDYAGLRKGTLCNQTSARSFLGFSEDSFLNDSYAQIEFEKIKNAFA